MISDQHQRCRSGPTNDEWLALADSYAKDVNSRYGCLFLQVRRSLADGERVRLHRGLKVRRRGAAHVKQPYVKRFFDTRADFGVAQPQIILHRHAHDGSSDGRDPAS